MVIEVRPARSPGATTLALVEPRIETDMDRSVDALEEASIWQAMIVARTVTQWDNKGASGSSRCVTRHLQVSQRPRIR